MACCRVLKKRVKVKVVTEDNIEESEAAGLWMSKNHI